MSDISNLSERLFEGYLIREGAGAKTHAGSSRVCFGFLLHTAGSGNSRDN